MCLECKVGKYQNETRSSSCKLCGVGKYLVGTGAEAETNCTVCAPGKGSQNLGATTPSVCNECEDIPDALACEEEEDFSELERVEKGLVRFVHVSIYYRSCKRARQTTLAQNKLFDFSHREHGSKLDAEAAPGRLLGMVLARAVARAPPGALGTYCRSRPRVWCSLLLLRPGRPPPVPDPRRRLRSPRDP